jgi:hypothetical protein
LPTGRQIATQQRLNCLKWQRGWERCPQPLRDPPLLQQAIHGAREIAPRPMRHLKLIELPIIGDPKRERQRAAITSFNCEQ